MLFHIEVKLRPFNIVNEKTKRDHSRITYCTGVRAYTYEVRDSDSSPPHSR